MLSEQCFSEKRAKFDVLLSPEVNSAEVSSIPNGEGRMCMIINWLSRKNIFGVYKNTVTGWDIAISRRNARSVISHGANCGKIALLEVVPDLIKNGIYLETANKYGSNLKSHLFVAKAVVDRKSYAICYVVREDNNGKRYYDHSLISKETLDRLPDQASRDTDKGFLPVHATLTTPTESLACEISTINILKKHLSVNT
jgi:hypothetical protein